MEDIGDMLYDNLFVEDLEVLIRYALTFRDVPALYEIEFYDCGFGHRVPDPEDLE